VKRSFFVQVFVQVEVVALEAWFLHDPVSLVGRVLEAYFFALLDSTFLALAAPGGRILLDEDFFAELFFVMRGDNSKVESKSGSFTFGIRTLPTYRQPTAHSNEDTLALAFPRITHGIIFTNFSKVELLPLVSVDREARGVIVPIIHPGIVGDLHSSDCHSLIEGVLCADGLLSATIRLAVFAELHGFCGFVYFA